MTCLQNPFNLGGGGVGVVLSHTFVETLNILECKHKSYYIKVYCRFIRYGKINRMANAK